MTIFHVLPLIGLIFGVVLGAELGARFGSAAGVVGAILGGALGLVLGRLPLVLVLKSIQKEFRHKTVEDLRRMLRDPAFVAPNVVLLELGSRGEDLDQELPAVLDMLVAPSRERRVRGWHALASAFPARARLMADYRVDDDPDECGRKIQKLRHAEPNTAPDAGPATQPGHLGVTEQPPSKDPDRSVIRGNGH